ncbi:hypothetical protein PROFUN_03126 [Planoprotostelium fungivorum]|uniref:Homeobox domain-containing protein n=1 Tax=Planoprotostelium fungivorum TaxID=1890364 RepID=A0A2P6NQA6_9EUKA|nr:hypothetical protein PROFUN_03126 [Planoprotostelium fungivorum]
MKQSIIPDVYKPKNANLAQIDPRLNDSIKHPPRIPPFYIVRCIILLLTIATVAVLPIVPLHFLPLIILLPLGQEKIWIEWCNGCTNLWFQCFLILLEKVNGYQLIFTGTNMKKEDWALGLCNHPSEADWVYFWSILERAGRMGQHRVIMKNIISNVPGIGWGMLNLEFLMLTRNWQKDEIQMEWSLRKYLKYYTPFFLLLFPEGTDFTPVKRARCEQWAKENDAPVYKRLLTPKVKGFQKAVYDFTVAYDDNVKPTIVTAMAGWYPKRIHYHIRRFSSDQIPHDEAQLQEWLYERYREKDTLLEYFTQNKRFPTPSDISEDLTLQFQGQNFGPTFLFGDAPICETREGRVTIPPFQMTPFPWMNYWWLAYLCIICCVCVWAIFEYSWVMWLFIVGWTFFICSSLFDKIKNHTSNAIEDEHPGTARLNRDLLPIWTFIHPRATARNQSRIPGHRGTLHPLQRANYVYMKISDIVHRTNTSSLPPIDFTSTSGIHEEENKNAPDVPEAAARARRVVLPQEQKDYLEAIFQEKPYPDNELKMELAERFKTTPRKIQVWFQNRRQKQKSENG